jgi:Subtilase family
VFETARVVRVEDERSPVAVQGWVTQPVTNHHVIIVREDVVANAGRAVIRGDVPSLIRAVADLERAASAGERAARLTMASRPADIARPDLTIFPVASHENSVSPLLCSGEIVAQFPSEVQVAAVESLAKSAHWFVARRISFLPNGFVLTASSSADPFEFANSLVERNGALLAHPVFLESIPDRSALAVANRGVPALLSKQWHLQNSGQDGGVSGVDIAALAAWPFTTGTPQIVACVIDSGISLTHECFSDPAKLVPGYDFQDNDPDPTPTTSSHGTSCGALIAAGPDSGQIRGVAPNCRLMPIRRPDVTNYLGLAEAFAWAADHGADVVSCSFGPDGPWVLPDIVRAAFQHVATQGRKGKGCPIFWAAGNGSELVSTDEWASSNYTIAVAASTDQGRRASYSDFGPEISICSPSSGGENGIVTAQNTGYTFEFGGTSAAAPIAAGVACLVLSLAPSLRVGEIKELLQKTARRIDPAGGSYDARGFSPYYGYGQIDALAALLGIPALLEIERATSLEASDGDIRAVIAYVKGGSAGQSITRYLSDRRLGILAEIQESTAFRDSMGRILRVISSAGASLNHGPQIFVPDEVWPDVELVLSRIRTMSTAVPTSDRSERSFISAKKEQPRTMPSTSNLDDALGRIASILGGSPGGAPPQPGSGTTSQPSPGTGYSPTTTQPPPAIDSGTGGGASLSDAQKAEIAQLVYYSMSLPPITREMLLQMEQGLPEIVDNLHSLNARPAMRAELLQSIESFVAAQGAERSESNSRIVALVGSLSRDAFGKDERNPLALLALGVASAALAYNVVHTWNK